MGRIGESSSKYPWFRCDQPIEKIPYGHNSYPVQLGPFNHNHFVFYFTSGHCDATAMCGNSVQLLGQSRQSLRRGILAPARRARILDYTVCGPGCIHPESSKRLGLKIQLFFVNLSVKCPKIMVPRFYEPARLQTKNKNRGHLVSCIG